MTNVIIYTSKRFTPLDVKAYNDEDEEKSKFLGEVTIDVATSHRDRVNDILQKGFLERAAIDLSTKNTSVFLNHKTDELPIGKVIKGELVQLNDGEYATRLRVGISKTAPHIMTLLEEGILDKASIGFHMQKGDYEYSEKDDALLIYNGEVVEASFVGVPANPNAKTPESESIQYMKNLREALKGEAEEVEKNHHYDDEDDKDKYHCPECGRKYDMDREKYHCDCSDGEDCPCCNKQEQKSENSYTDYPKSATNNAKKVIRWKEEHGDEVKGMTQVGWRRARQLANRDPLSKETVKRMAQFNRHRKNAEIDPKYKDTPWKDNGYVAWLGWGGTSGINWAITKAESFKSFELEEDELQQKNSEETTMDKQEIETLMETLLERNSEAYEKRLESQSKGFDEKINEQSSEIAELKGAITERDELIKSLEAEKVALTEKASARKTAPANKGVDKFAENRDMALLRDLKHLGELITDAKNRQANWRIQFTPSSREDRLAAFEGGSN